MDENLRTFKSTNDFSLVRQQKKLESIMSTTDLPDFLTDMNAVLKHVECKWLNGTPPDYSASNKLYREERSVVHETGSLADKVNNLIKNWERELSYKMDINEWKTAVPTFRINVNGGGWLCLPELVKIGAYNAFLGDTEYYCASRIPSHTSHQIFRTALSNGFGWECIETYSPPPLIVFKWRHWGPVTGEFKCPMRNGQQVLAPPVGNTVEIFGITKIRVNEHFQILEMENFFRADQMIEKIVKGAAIAKSSL